MYLREQLFRVLRNYSPDFSGNLAVYATSKGKYNVLRDFLKVATPTEPELKRMARIASTTSVGAVDVICNWLEDNGRPRDLTPLIR